MARRRRSPSRTSPMRDATPVEVSLCTTHTALMRLSLSARRRFVDRLGSAPWRQSPCEELDLEAELRRHLLPQGREVAGLGHQHAIAGRKRVDQRRFPGAGAGSRVDHDLALRRLEDALHAGEHRLAEIGEFRAAMIHRRQVDRAQHAIRDVGRTRDLQEVTAGACGACWYSTSLDELPRCAPRQGARRRGPVRHTASRGRYSTDASIYQVQPIGVVVPRSEEAARTRDGDRRGAGRADPAARRGQLAVRAGGRRGAGHRSQQVPQPGFSKSTSRRERALVQPGVVLDALNARAAAQRPVVPGRRLDQRAGDARRDGGQQLLRLALDRVRQHGAQRARDRRGRRSLASSGASGRWIDRAAASTASSSAGCKASTSGKRRRSRRAFRSCCARSRATTSITSARRTRTPRTCCVGSEGTLAYSERILLKLSALPARRSLGVCHFRSSSTGRWR